MLEPTVLDAFIAGLSTAFFGALVAGGAYLLRQQIILRDQVESLRAQVVVLDPLERMLRQSRQTLKTTRPASEDDGPDA